MNKHEDIISYDFYAVICKMSGKRGRLWCLKNRV